MGAMGSDAAIEAVDIVLMDDDPKKISLAIRIAKKCMRIVYENIYFAIGIKLLCLLLGAFDIASMPDKFFHSHSMTFVWDQDKYELNLRKHRISFYDAAAVFDDPQIEMYNNIQGRF